MLINAVVINEGSINSDAGSGNANAELVKKAIISRRYICTITGAADAVDDAVIPISSISSRIKANTVSSLTVVCPNGVDYAATVAARSNGGVIITAEEIYNDGSIDTSDWPEYPITTIRYDQGSRSYSITLTCNLTRVYPFTKKIRLSGISYIAQQANGGTTVRCDLDKDFSPGDTAILSDDSEIIITAITHIISPTVRYMELTT